ncbi:hypothetical protein TVAG_277950 [Trichomonas vaginalis G3]|uniref:Uncharacterized protein n=1 Tax=Trichomonas vaginalis (strain ATCC PRA-98 / G3) TaxID=412133 RepID=A2DU36_TRIV3|nr:hypothetical protein TVAGG3_0438930 [Trichomonas vaginalis G3]EAY16029.1 hypothetical protein TVAG_277950 [Trichomonas vaginalis G3]KAI5537311.1 hypothetical protein TVAGG3_0438930 [Trichomonas vaginalis G3]|eukprot:XP_001328252.1 hypothetical protein [Trichomonas vaginalis G3]
MLGLRTPPEHKSSVRSGVYGSGSWEAEAETTSRRNNYEYENQYSYDSYQNNGRASNKPYMSSLASMYGDYNENLERKRRMQEQLAESLRQQIEEKKAAQKSAYERQPKIPTYSNQPMPDLNTRQQIQPIQQPLPPQPAPQVVYASQPVNRVSFAPQIVLTQNEPQARTISRAIPVEKFVPLRATLNITQPHQITVPTESPFDRQKVETPPLGFSIRHAQPVKSSLAQTMKPINRVLPLNPGKNPMFYSAKPKSTFVQDDEYNAKPDYPGPPTGGDFYQLKPLECYSDLIYPDGHISSR